MKSYVERIREARTELSPSFEKLADFLLDSYAHAALLTATEIGHSLDLTRRSFSVEHAEALISALDEAQRVILLAEGLALAPAQNLAAWLEAAGYNIHLAGGSISDLARALTGARR